MHRDPKKITYKNIFYTVIANIIPLLVAIITIPKIINTSGYENFGLLMYFWSILTVIGLADFGVSKAILFNNSQTSNMETNRQTLIIGLFASVGVSTLYFLIFIALASLSINHTTITNATSYNDAKSSLIVIGLIIFPTIISAALRSALEAQQNFLISSTTKMITQSAIFLAPTFAVVRSDPENFLFNTFAILLAVRLISTAILLVKVARSHGLNLRDVTSQKPIKKRDFILDCAWFGLNGFTGPILGQSDKWFMTLFFGAATGGIYATASQIVTKFLLFPSAVVTVYFPKFAAHLDNKDRRISNLLVTVSTTIFATSAITWGEPILKWWLSESYTPEILNFGLILLLGVVFNALAQLPYTELQARGYSKHVSIIQLTELFLIVSLYIGLASQISQYTIPAIWSLRALIDFLALSILRFKLS